MPNQNQPNEVQVKKLGQYLSAQIQAVANVVNGYESGSGATALNSCLSHIEEDDFNKIIEKLRKIEPKNAEKLILPLTNIRSLICLDNTVILKEKDLKLLREVFEEDRPTTAYIRSAVSNAVEKEIGRLQAINKDQPAKVEEISREQAPSKTIEPLEAETSLKPEKSKGCC